LVLVRQNNQDVTRATDFKKCNVVRRNDAVVLRFFHTYRDADAFIKAGGASLEVIKFGYESGFFGGSPFAVISMKTCWRSYVHIFFIKINFGLK
jgi:hypothetical protein